MKRVEAILDDEGVAEGLANSLESSNTLGQLPLTPKSKFGYGADWSQLRSLEGRFRPN